MAPTISALLDPDRPDHSFFHPRPQQDCGLCPETTVCVYAWCQRVKADCPDWFGHADKHRESELTWWRGAA